MASKKLQSASASELDDMKMDMSPMIDMVFLLLIFFMVASTMITDRKDKDIVIPVTPSGQDVKSIKGRITINVYSKAVIKSENKPTPYADVDSNSLTVAQITKHIKERAKMNKDSGVRQSILYVRGDKDAMVQQVKTVVAAAAAAGVNDVIFSGYSR